MDESLKLLPRYILNHGLLHGVLLFLKVELLNLEEFKFNEFAKRIHLRRGTTDRKVFREVFLFKSYSISFPSPPKVIIDAGANIGLTTLFFRKLFPEATIYAIEPDNFNFNILLKNIENHPNIVALRTALWPSVKSLKIKTKNQHEWAFEVQECSEGEPESFKSVSIPSLIDQYKIDSIDFLKLDIEGSERELFLTNTEKWLPKTKVITIELHDWIKDGCSMSFFGAIAKYNFRSQINKGMLVVTLA